MQVQVAQKTLVQPIQAHSLVFSSALTNHSPVAPPGWRAGRVVRCSELELPTSARWAVERLSIRLSPNLERFADDEQMRGVRFVTTPMSPVRETAS
jgi:hypothetical protein